MLILVGPSASGKTEVASLLIKKYGMKKMITCTTRPMRQDEINGVSYHFYDKEEFLKRKANDEFVENTIYNDNYYGTLKKDISNDKIVILEPNGVNSFYEKMANDVVIVLLQTDINMRKERMKQRGDSNESINQRIANDDFIFQKNKLLHVDLIVVNENKKIDDLALEIYNFYQTFNK